MHVELELELPREARVVRHLRRSIRSISEEMGVADDDLDAIALALAEACNNVIEHARSDDDFSVSYRLADGVAIISVRNAQTPHLVLGSDVPADLDSVSGRGLSIMRHLVDDARFETSDEGGTLVRLSRAFTPRKGSLLADA